MRVNTQNIVLNAESSILEDDSMEPLLQNQNQITEIIDKKHKNAYIETYGCQMNFADSEVVASVLEKTGYTITDNPNSADLILLNTCSIREKAEQRVRNRLSALKYYQKQNPKLKIGVLGCMAERLKHKFLEEEKIVDLVVGPDAYRDLPNLLNHLEDHREAVNVLLSKEETYSDISPLRLNSNGVSAFVSITRGCDNMCTFCVVPFTRGRERSRDPKSILQEIETLAKTGYKEVTLLGQNVDSYIWYGGGLKKDFAKASALQKKTALSFDKLLALVAKSFPELRIRFTTSNPQDMTPQVMYTIAEYDNICKHIHLPVQSGSNRILKLMNRQHTREEYLELIDSIRTIIPNCGISHDMISGFPTETLQDHEDTLSLMEYVQYHYGFMFVYSERPNTLAARKLKDDIPLREKKRRLNQIIDLQHKHSSSLNQQMIGKTCRVLIEKASRKSNEYWSGRTTQNTVVVFPKEHYKIGEYVDVIIQKSTPTTLVGAALDYAHWP
ncbi:MAG: tRNA (N6-isopentenyl adenosine(37)-C2)-methylthiotransferase MiaB [Flavobacteriaceae bacterium]|nr:tRNA (N6-isopentenyl adenosine(37)-C2)-methylthiotransferase MiaB [Flavobacteriaceae bacterium]